MSNTYKRTPQNNLTFGIHRAPRHRQQLAEYYAANADRLPKVRIQDFIIKEGCYQDKVHSRCYSERKEQGRRKVRRLKRRRVIKKKHPRVTWIFFEDK